MRNKGLLFALGTVCVLSFGSISFSPKMLETHADGVVDIGEVSFSLNQSLSTTSGGIYLIADSNAFPVKDWDYKLFSNESTAVLRNGVAVCTPNLKITKCQDTAYYLGNLSDIGFGTRTEGETYTLQGNWQGTVNGTTYTLSAKPIVVKWTNNRWKEEFVVPELEPYDEVTLVNAGYDDFNRVVIGEEKAPCAWNTFTTKPENTRNSFYFEFEFEAYGQMKSGSDKTLDIRIGSNGSWDTGHFYKLCLCNTWGPQGVILFDEYNGAGRVKNSGDIAANLQAGTRHTIGCGSIYIKDSNDTYEFVTFDGEYLYQKINTPYSHDRTTKIGLSYVLNNIYIGSSKGQKANDSVLSLNHSNGNKGLYLDGPVNSIPVDSDWKVRGAPASKYNALLNGEPLYNYGMEKCPLVKHSNGESDNYYLSFDDYGITFKEGDVVTLSDEFHFYWGNTPYSMSITPVSFLFRNNKFEQISNLADYLYGLLENHNDPDYYSDENVEAINAILLDASTALPAETSMKNLWDLYKDYLVQLDAVPMDEEKAAALIQQAKDNAINYLNNYVDPSLYAEEQLTTLQGYLDSAIASINAATSVAEINNIVESTKALIDAVPTKQAFIEQKILSTEDGYEQYLEAYDVFTTTDLCAVGSLGFYSDERSYSSGGYDDFSTRIATSLENEDGNLVFQFNYETNNPASSRYGAQVYIRLRGTDATCYRYSIGTSVDDGFGVAADAFINDQVAPGSRGVYNANFAADTTYRIECGSIDLKDYDRTFMFIKLYTPNDAPNKDPFVVKKIVDSISNDQKPVIRIMDSFTGDEDAVTYLSPIEEGTTKGNNSSLLGRLILNPDSNNESLSLTLRKNELPVGSTLYPVQQGAFKINGNEVPDYRSATRIRKISTNNYLVQFDYESLQDGDVITIGGYFAAFDEVEARKTIYSFYDITLTYDGTTNSWSQTPPTLEVARKEAKEIISSYADLNNYSEAGKNAINGIVASYSNSIDAATTVEEVEALLEEALLKIDAVPTLLVEYKTAKKQELTDYKSADLYRQEEQEELAKILNDAFIKIDNCSDKASIDIVVSQAKSSIDALKTAAQRDAEDLADEKKKDKAEVEAYIGLLDMNRYSDENAELIRNLALKARQDIENATSIEEARNILNKFKEDIKNVKTKDGSIFDGEKYIEKKKKGCGGEIASYSLIIPVLAVMALFILVLLRRKEFKFNK